MRHVEVVLVQHAEKEVAPGDPGLTAVGRLQAERVAANLAVSPWDLLVCSPMRRARETAEIVGSACGIAPVIDERLRERMNWGDAPFAQTAVDFAADWAHATRDRFWSPPSGDSSNATAARVVEALDEIVARDHVRRALVVTHGGATVDLLRTIVGDAQLRSAAPVATEEGIPNCGLTPLVHEERWHVSHVGGATL